MISRAVQIALHLLVLRPFVMLFLGVNLYAEENLKHLKRFIIIANHNSHLDILLLFFALPIRQIPLTHPVAAKEYFSRSKILFALVEFLFQPLWVSRGDLHAQREFLSDVSTMLEKGQNIILFPEGTRGNPGEMLTFKSAIGKIAEQYREIPIVPVFLSGPERSLPKETAIPVPFWNNMLIGPPQLFDGPSREITRHLEEMLQRLSMNEAIVRKRQRKSAIPAIRSVAVLGIDGSGKSTLARTLAQRLSKEGPTALVSDRLELYESEHATPMQPLLAENVRTLLGRYAKKARSLALYKVPKLTELLLRDHLIREIRRWYHAERVVLDGSSVLNLAAWAVLYKPEFFDPQVCRTAIEILTSSGVDAESHKEIFLKFPELLTLRKLHLTHLSLPDIVLFIDVPPETAFARILSRGEQIQVHETEEKLAALQRSYRQVCDVIRLEFEVPTLVLNGGQEADAVAMEAMQFIHQFSGKEPNNA